MRTFWSDVRHGLRLVVRRPGFSAVAAIALALGIGPNVAIFSVVRSVLLLPPPYPDPDRIVSTAARPAGRVNIGPRTEPSTDDFQDWRQDTRTLSHMALAAPDALTLTGTGDPIRLTGARVSPALFPMLGVAPEQGRVFTEQEEQPSAAPTVLISRATWEQHFGSDAAIVGKSITLEGTARQVVGIMPAGFAFPTRDTQYWVPYTLAPPQRSGNDRRVAVVPFFARLKPGVSIAEASAEGGAVIARSRDTGIASIAGRPAALRLVTLQERNVGSLRTPLLVLSAAVGLVLLIACANVANLLLSQAASRQRDVAIRTALGATRGRIVRQMLAESAVLSAIGGGLGVVFAVWCVAWLPRMGGVTFAPLQEVHLDWLALTWAGTVSALSTLLFGLAPALVSARRGLSDAIRRRPEAGSGGLRLLGRNVARSVLTVTQVALALVLMVGASLLARSLMTLVGQPLGYRPEHALAVQVQLPAPRYPQPLSRTALVDQVLAGLRQTPGISAAGATNLMPMSQAQIGLGFSLPGAPETADANDAKRAGVRLVSAGFFRALGSRVLAGREFEDADQATSEPVVLINKALASRYFAGVDPVGRQIDADKPRRIVGVVESIKPNGFDSDPAPEVYFPLTQFDQILMMGGPLAATTFVVRTVGAPLDAVASVRAQVARLDPQLPLFNIATLEQRVSDSVSQPRFFAGILGLFAVLALAVAGVGIYGVLASQVAQSTRVIGIQMAIGAGPARVRGSIVAHGAALTAAGVAVGLVGAWGLTRFLGSLLFGITPMDPTSYAGAAAALGLTALAGIYVPARRATTVDPVVALRSE